MRDFMTYEEMIKAVIPTDITDEERQFFQKWFGKFGLNSEFNTNKFIELIKKKNGINKNNFRDLLFSVGTQCQFENTKTILKYSERKGDDFKKYVQLLNQSNLVNVVQFLLDERELITSNSGKESKLLNAIGYLEKLVNDFSYNDFKLFKKIIKIIESIPQEKSAKFQKIFEVAEKLKIDDKDKTWLSNKKNKIIV